MIGPLVTTNDICTAMQTTVQLWLPSVLTELHALGAPLIPAPTNYAQLPDELANTSATYPAVIVSSPGLAAPPEYDGDGTVDEITAVVVSIWVRGQSYDDTAVRTRTYVDAIKIAVAQHQTLGGLAAYSRYADKAFSLARDDTARTLALGHVMFNVRVEDTFDVYEGAATPPPAGELTPDYFTVIDTPVTVNRET